MRQFLIILNILSAALLLGSFLKDRAKTRAALNIARQSAIKLLPNLLLVVGLIGLLLGLTPREWLSRYLGEQSGFLGVLTAGLVGAVVMIQSFVVMPLAGSLLQAGASVTVIATFITTLTMVGVVTLPVEIAEMGKRFALWRNLLSFIMALVIGLLMGAIL